MAVDQYNNQGQNQVGQANVAQNNEITQANTQLANDYNSQQVQTLLDLLAGGQTIDPSSFQEWTPEAVAPRTRSGPAPTLRGAAAS